MSLHLPEELKALFQSVHDEIDAKERQTNQANLLAELLEAMTIKHQGVSEHRWGTDSKGQEMDDWGVSFSPLFVPYGTKSYPAEKAWATQYSTGLGHRVGYRPRTKRDQGAVGRVKAPNKLDILYSLILDGRAIEQCWQDWADEYGYDSDSIKAKGVYDSCIEIGIKMRNWLGHEKLAALREYFEENPR